MRQQTSTHRHRTLNCRTDRIRSYREQGLPGLGTQAAHGQGSDTDEEVDGEMEVDKFASGLRGQAYGEFAFSSYLGLQRMHADSKSW